MGLSVFIIIVLSTIIAAAVLFIIVEFYIVIIGHLMGAPFVPSRKEKIKKMVELAKIKHGEKIMDLGSGDGSILIEAAKQGAKAIGIEINPFLVWYSRMRAKKQGVQTQVLVERKDFRKVSLQNTDVVFLYLWPSTLEKLSPKLISELKPGARIISNAFPLPRFPLVTEDHHIFLYKK